MYQAIIFIIMLCEILTKNNLCYYFNTFSILFYMFKLICWVCLPLGPRKQMDLSANGWMKQREHSEHLPGLRRPGFQLPSGTKLEMQTSFLSLGWSQWAEVSFSSKIPWKWSCLYFQYCSHQPTNPIVYHLWDLLSSLDCERLQNKNRNV